MQPNIIFFFADQQRADTLNIDVMPNLMELAKSGVTFDNTYTCQPVCGPARACLQTGVYATQNGSYINAVPLCKDRHLLAESMKSAGYDVAYVGKWHLASGIGPSQPHYEKKAVPLEYRGGYDDYWMASDVLEFTSDGYHGYVFDKDNNKVEFEGIRADNITDYALSYIDNRQSQKPFFMFLSHIEPHHQNSTDDFECAPEDADKYINRAFPSDLEGVHKGNYTKKYARYLSCCNRLDYNLGRLIEHLKAKGIYENTIIIYTADHGCHFKTRNAEYKRSCHDGSIKIPLVIHGGAYKGGVNIDELVSLIDLPVTILRAAGADVPSDYIGMDVRNLLSGETNRDAVYIEISESQTGRCLRTKRYTYSVKTRSFNYFRKSGKVYVEDYLYDNEIDPSQHKNLIRDRRYKSVRHELRARLINEIETVEGYTPRIRSRILPSHNI